MTQRCFQSDTRWCPLAQPTGSYLLVRRQRKQTEQKKEALGGEQKERLDFYASGDAMANGRPSHTGGHVSATARAAWLLEQTHQGSEEGGSYRVHTGKPLAGTSNWNAPGMLAYLPNAIYHSRSNHSLFPYTRLMWTRRAAPLAEDWCCLPSEDFLPLQVEKPSFQPVKCMMLSVPPLWGMSVWYDVKFI